MLFRNRTQALVPRFLAVLAVFAALSPIHARAQDEDAKPEKHGRKYKPPPETSHIEITVLKGFNKKPIDGAHVVLHPVKDGLDEGNLEIKTHQDGKAVIDVIPTGSSVRIQVLADGFATFADDYVINEASREITISMIRPRAQISTYIDNEGKPAQIQPGVQEPIRKKAAAPASPSSTPSSPSATTPAPADPSGTKPQS
jgi:hypothetical protein